MHHLEANHRYEDIVPLPLRCLTRLVPVDPELVDRLIGDIRSEGLLEPLAVVDTTIGEWKARYHHDPYLLEPPDLPDDTNIYLVQRGNNRLAAAEKLGYDMIDCLIFKYYREAGEFSDKQRRRTKGWGTK